MEGIGYKEVLGFFTIIIGIYAYIPYIHDIFLGKTKPHIFTWLLFVIMDAIAFLIQFGDNAGPGSWGILTTGIGAGIVLILSILKGEKNITHKDIIALILALVSIILYVYLEDVFYSQIMIFMILTFAIYPTFWKSYFKPEQETLSLYIIAIIRSMLSILAVMNVSFYTIGTPLFIIVINTLFISMVLIRRKQLS